MPKETQDGISKFRGGRGRETGGVKADTVVVWKKKKEKTRHKKMIKRKNPGGKIVRGAWQSERGIGGKSEPRKKKNAKNLESPKNLIKRRIHAKAEKGSTKGRNQKATRGGKDAVRRGRRGKETSEKSHYQKKKRETKKKKKKKKKKKNKRR